MSKYKIEKTLTPGEKRERAKENARKEVKNLRDKARRMKSEIEEIKTKVTSTSPGKKGRVIEPERVAKMEKPLRDIANENILFKPNDGPQTEFLAAPETDVLYGGAAGGGKSFAMLVDPLRYAHLKEHRALILRKTMPELRELIDKSRELYPKAFPGCKFKEVEKVWTFPSGAKIEFGFLEKDSDVYRYQGQAYSWIGFDEITHLASEFPWNYLASRLRTTNPDIIPYLRCTANPGGIGHCVPYGEVLTTTGWKPIQDVVVGESVLSQTPEGELVYKLVEQTHEYDGDEISVYDGNTYHIACTSQHKIPVVTETKTKDGRVFHPFKLREEQFLKEVTRLPEVGKWAGESPDVVSIPEVPTRKLRNKQPLELPSELFVKLLGWYLSEGCTIDRDKAFSIAQDKPEERKIIKQLLIACGFVFSESKSQFTVYSPSWYSYFKQFGKSREKFIPENVKHLSVELLQFLIETLMLGDGSNGIYYTISEQLANDVCEVGLKAGYRINLRSRQRRNRVGLSYEISLKQNKKAWIEKKNRTVEKWDGKVYCLGVQDTHTFYIRQQGHVWLSGNSWVKKRYVEPAEANTKFVRDGIDTKFIPARLEDNPYLTQDGRYEQMLKSLPEVHRRRLLEGDWDVTEGAAFPEFDIKTHTVQPFDIPVGWNRIKSVDYGYTSPSCCLWGAINPEDGTIFIYRELYERGLVAEELAEKMTERERDEYRSIPGVLDTAAWNKTGYTGPTIGELLCRGPYGHKLRPADKNRKAGKIQIHQYLKVQGDVGKPLLLIFDTCTNLIREMQTIPLSETDSEDVDTHAEDHAYDALRYMLMSRPRKESPHEIAFRFKQEAGFLPADSTFGY